MEGCMKPDKKQELIRVLKDKQAFNKFCHQILFRLKVYHRTQVCESTLIEVQIASSNLGAQTTECNTALLISKPNNTHKHWVYQLCQQTFQKHEIRMILHCQTNLNTQQSLPSSQFGWQFSTSITAIRGITDIIIHKNMLMDFWLYSKNNKQCPLTDQDFPGIGDNALFSL